MKTNKCYEEVDVIQSGDEWLQWRRSHICATDTAKILGISKYGNALSCYNEKIEAHEEEENEYMRYGRDKEPEARAFLEKTLHLKLKPRVFVSTDYPFMGASLDAVTEGCEYGYEIKCLSHDKITQAQLGKVEPMYQVQVQKQMLVMGWTNTSILFYESPQHYHLMDVKRDELLIKKIVEKETEFWHNLVNLTPPVIYIDGSEPFIDHAKLYRDTVLQIKELESEKTRLKTRLIELSGGANTKGGGVTLRASKGRRIVNWKQVQEEYKIKESDLEEFSYYSKDGWTANID